MAGGMVKFMFLPHMDNVLIYATIGGKPLLASAL
jgi:hypothetical protein